MDAQTFFGVWSPLDTGKLPIENTKDIDFGAWYITETGTIGEDPVAYKEGDWLIYICEARGGLAERQFWKTTNSLAVFNHDPSFNTPEAGHYTKILTDNLGNIVDAGDITYDDLPIEAKKKFEDFEGDHLKAQILSIVKEIFTSSVDDTVVFQYDPTLGTIRANAKIDEDTIFIDDDGYLASQGGGGEGGSSTPSGEYAPKKHTHKVEDVIGIDEHFGKFLASQDFVTILQHNLLEIIDGTTLIVNADGQLAINPDVIEGGGGEGGGDCANHQHEIDDIIGLKEFIIQYISTVSLTEEFVSNLNKYVDGVTITINKDGKLSAVAMKVGPHQHKMNDITDLNQNIADVWASNQTFHNEEIDFSVGASDLSGANIGQAVSILNKTLEEVKKTADEALHNSEHLEPKEPNTLGETKISILGDTLKVLDTTDYAQVDAYAQVAFSTTIVWHRGSTYNVYIDGELFDSLDTEGESVQVGEHGHFNVIYFGDAYPEVKTFQGYYNGLAFEFESGELPEGYHTLVVEEVPLDVTLPAIRLPEVIIPTFKPISFGVTEFLDIPTQSQLIDYYVSGVGCCRNILNVGMTIKAICYDTIFAPLKQIRIWTSLSNEWKEVLAHSFTAGMGLYTLNVPFEEDFKGRIIIKAQAQTVDGRWGPEKEYITPYINRDTTHIEKRCRTTETGNDFIAKDPLSVDEAQIINDNLVLAKINWEEVGIGPDYSHNNEVQHIYLRFPLEVSCSNLYFDIFDKDGNEPEINKYGELKNINIKGLVSNSFTISPIENWFDCNKPWKRNSFTPSNDYCALDLFKSTASRRWITFGKTVRNGSYLYLKIEINEKSSVDLLKLESSIQECINERK